MGNTFRQQVQKLHGPRTVSRLGLMVVKLILGFVIVCLLQVLAAASFDERLMAFRRRTDTRDVSTAAVRVQEENVIQEWTNHVLYNQSTLPGFHNRWSLPHVFYTRRDSVEETIDGRYSSTLPIIR